MGMDFELLHKIKAIYIFFSLSVDSWYPPRLTHDNLFPPPPPFSVMIRVLLSVLVQIRILEDLMEIYVCYHLLLTMMCAL